MTSPLKAFNRWISELQKKPVAQARGISIFDETCFYQALVSLLVATLSYHKIGNPPSDGWMTWNYISAEEFMAQLEWFQNRGWDFLSAPALLEALKGKRALPAKSILITFDDAYESLLENAVPVLKRFSAPAVVFAPTQFVGETNLFDHGVEPLERIADWNTLGALEDSGVSVESHGSSHRGFSSLSAVEIEQELDFSRQAIRKNLGKDSRMFAFPYGDCGHDQTVVHSALRRAGYDVAFLYGGGIFEPDRAPSPLFLPRLAMGPGVDLDAMLLESSGS